jgi:1-acyl-sn-glycerol-3-phosphate acyltransferase
VHNASVVPPGNIHGVSRFPVRRDGGKALRYRVVSGAVRAAIRLWLGRRLDLGALRQAPEQTPVLVVANHLSNLDPPLFGAFFPHTLFAMAKVELFSNRLLGWTLTGCNVFPVNRSRADRKALKTALQVLSGPHRLLLFVEGTRAPAPGMQKAEPGVGYFVRKSGASILPVGVWGTERAWPPHSAKLRRRDVKMRVGSLVPASELVGSDDQATADAVARCIAELLPAAYQGVYAV